MRQLLNSTGDYLKGTAELDMLSSLLKLASIFGLSFFQFGISIPLGIGVLHLEPVAVVLTTLLSYVAGVAVVMVFGERLRSWILRRFGNKITDNPNSRVRRIWDRYGVIGLSLLAPMTTGSQIGTVIAVTLGASPRRVFFWMTVGAILWAAIITGAVLLGLVALPHPKPQ